MMHKKIIFLSKQMLDARNFERFGIELLQKNGFDVEYWDATPLLYPAVFKIYKLQDQVKFDGLKIFHEKQELYKQLISLEKDSFVIDLVSFDFNLLGLYKALKRSKADYIAYATNALPHSTDIDRAQSFRSVLLRKMKNACKYSFPELWRGKILPHIPLQLFGIKPARFILAGGTESRKKYKIPTNKNTKIIWAHTYDYDIYLRESKSESRERPVAVYLDFCLPFSPNWAYVGMQPDLNPDKFYSLVNNFFDAVERKLNLEVVIAAHPRSDYENMPDYFRGRKCIKGQTARLVKEAKLVLAHFSSSVNFANLFYKPIIFLTYDGLYGNSLLEALSELHGKKPVNIGREINVDWNSELKVSKSHYDNYRRAFIKTDYSENLPLWQIVANRLKKDSKIST